MDLFLEVIWLRVAILAVAFAASAVAARRPSMLFAARFGLGGWAGLNIAFLVYLWMNHIGFPLHLEIMEGPVLQHLSRAVAGQAIYSSPDPSYIPLAYNPLYYVLCIPFAWLFGANLFTLRLVAILGMAAIGWMLYSVVRVRTGSSWWGLLAAGLFAAAYRVMDAFLDSAHADSWFILSALAGTALLQANRSRPWNVLGVVALVLSFWFKQHGVWFAIGGLLFLTAREGARRSWPYWLTAALLGPVAYLWPGPLLFGTQFHYFTWEVPARWSELRLLSAIRYPGFLALYYLPLVLAALVGFVRARSRLTEDAWLFLLPFALLTGAMGSLDWGSSDNIYIAQGVWLILAGVSGLAEIARQRASRLRMRIDILGLTAAFALFLYNPASVITPDNADTAYADFLGEMSELQGQVYAPSIGHLPDARHLYPAIHWVPLEDMVRGPRGKMGDDPLVHDLLRSAREPEGKAFILTHVPLGMLPVLASLEDSYTLETDYGDRFEPLRLLPKRFDHGWPRYLYKHVDNRLEQTRGGAKVQ